MSKAIVNKLATRDGVVDLEVKHLLVRDSAMENLGEYEQGIELKTVQQYFMKDGIKFTGKAFQLPLVLSGDWETDSVYVETYGDQWDHDKLYNKDIPDAHTAEAISFKQEDFNRSVADKLRETVSILDIGSVGKGADDSAILQKAIDFVYSRGGGVVELPPGIYLIEKTIQLKPNVHLVGSGPESILRLNANVNPIQTSGVRHTEENNFLRTDAIIGSQKINVAGGSGVNFSSGDLVVVLSEAKYSLANDQKLGELTRVENVVGDTLELSSPLTNEYKVDDLAQVQRISPVKNISIKNLTIDNANPHAFQRNYIGLLYCESYVIENVNAKGLSRAAIVPIGCIGGRITNCQGVDMLSPAQGEPSYLGYLVNETGANFGLIVEGCYTDRARHLYTCDTTSVLPYGLPRGTRVIGCVAKDSRGAGFDTHEEGEDIGFIGCTSDGSRGAGFQIRSRRTFIQGGSAENSRGPAVWLEKDSVDCTVSDLNVRNCGLYNDAHNKIDWRETGAIYVDAPGSVVKGCITRDSGGPGISFGPNARNILAQGNAVINPCRLSTGNFYGIGTTHSLGTQIDVWDNNVRDEFSIIEYGFFVNSSNSLTWLKGNRSSGHTIAPYWTGGYCTDNYGQSREAVVRDGYINNDQLDISMTNSRYINLHGENNENDTLLEILSDGVNVNGEILIKKGNGQITLKHNTPGPDGGSILLADNTDVTLTGSNSFILLKKLTNNVWCEMWRRT